MIATIAGFIARTFNLRPERVIRQLNRLVITLAALLFIVLATLIVAFDSLFPSGTRLSSLQAGDLATQDIFAPESITYISDELTRQQREAARAAARPIYEAPNPLIARQQTDLAQQIVDYIDNVRRDEFADFSQKEQDISRITALVLDEPIIGQIIEIDNDTWQDIDNQILSVLEGAFQNEIRETDLERIRSLLPTQVSVRFNDSEAAVIVAIVSDLIRSNTRLDEAATEATREAAANAVPPQSFSIERGQLIVSDGERISAADYEALQQLGLLQPAERRLQQIGQALLSSIIVMVVIGLYLLRFQPSLIYQDLSLLTLLSGIFIIVLAGARLGLLGEIYIYPTAAMALLFVSITGPQVAIIAVLGLAFLVGIMADQALEVASLVAVGGIISALTLRRSERLNSFFFAGLMVSVVNIAVAVVFNLDTPVSNNPGQFVLLITYAFLNGILTAAAALAGMYIVTLVFNLPTALKLAELSQPNQPLLQRLLREAPGTYQHTLQVANLAEQAANAIGANAELTHVAALYHDIGKMLNPAFFTENQRDIGNPHDTLDDPYRSAEIIISHVTGGDDMARQARLPNRIRDFIREHHGTSQVFVFYKQAVILADDDESLVDRADFTYPGPKPQSRETAILMLADSCEAAVRSSQSKTKQEIADTIQKVFDGRLKSGQLDDSGLTFKDIKVVQAIFVDVLQGIFHPRINYADAVSRVRKPRAVKSIPEKKSDTQEAPATQPPAAQPPPKAAPPVPKVTMTSTSEVPKVPEPAVMAPDDEEDDAPLTEVPRLRRTTEGRAIENKRDTEDYEHRNTE